MSSLKVLITGGSGLLGQYLNIELSKHYQILTVFNSNPGNCIHYNSANIDLINLDQLEEVFTYFKPDIVVHTASISRIDLANRLSEKYVTGVNVEATRRLAELCNKYNSRLIYTSTDLVYDGSYGSMLVESAPLKPASFYAETKLSGEEQIKKTFENYVILRTALLYGLGLNHSENYFGILYNNLRTGISTKLFDDQYRTPLSIKDASRIIAEIINKELNAVTINFGGKERVSRYELGEVLCEEGGFDKSLLVRTSMKDVPDIPRTTDVSMNTSKLNSLGIEQTPLRKSIKEIIKERE